MVMEALVVELSSILPICFTVVLSSCIPLFFSFFLACWKYQDLTGLVADARFRQCGKVVGDANGGLHSDRGLVRPLGKEAAKNFDEEGGG